MFTKITSRNQLTLPKAAEPDLVALRRGSLQEMLLTLHLVLQRINVNLATQELDGPTYALVQSAFNRNVRHVLFFAFFFGPLPLGLLTLASAWQSRRQSWWWANALILVAYALGIVLFTREVNLPLNYLTESWTPASLPEDWQTVRDAWNRANAWRAILCTGLFGLGLLALVQRAHASHQPRRS